MQSAEAILNLFFFTLWIDTLKDAPLCGWDTGTRTLLHSDISMGVKCVLNIFVAVAVCNMCFTLETFYGKKKLRPLFVLWLQFFTRFEQVNLVSNK